MEWAKFSNLADPQFFLVTEQLVNIERKIASKGCEKQTDALYFCRRFEYPWAFLQIPENAEIVLDAGGGPATFQYLLSAFIPHVHNVDYNPEWVKKVNAVKEVTGEFSNLTVTKGDISNLSFIPDKTFDVTTCLSVIEHSAHSKAIQIFDELLRVTNGPVLITVDVGVGGPELLEPEMLYILSLKYGFTVPPLPSDTIACVTREGYKFKVACIRLEGGQVGE